MIVNPPGERYWSEATTSSQTVRSTSVQARPGPSENKPPTRLLKRKGLAGLNHGKETNDCEKELLGYHILICWVFWGMRCSFRFSYKTLSVIQQQFLLDKYWIYNDVTRQKDCIGSLIKKMVFVSKRNSKED